jgi:S-adenosylmethionine:diacylglycerol 3-amino-3-carboxypropyl transferase
MVLFGRMYEDVAIEREAFVPGSRVFSIASSGCTAMALAADHEVTAVDINPVQLDYAQRRAAGAAAQVGVAERVMGIGRRALAPAGWRRKTLESFLALDDPREQLAFWNQHLNTRRFRCALEVMLSATWLRTVYAAPLLRVLPPHFARVMRGRMERCWALHPNRSNRYARALLLGELAGGPSKPPSAAIRFVCADAASYLESCAPGAFDGFTLSNILDGAPDDYRRRLFAALSRAGSRQSAAVFRSFAEPEIQAVANNLAAQDRSMLWGVVEIRRVSELRV